jgi:hypothetical protein
MEATRTGVDNIEDDRWEEIPDEEEQDLAIYAEATAKAIAGKLADPAPAWLAEAITGTVAAGLCFELDAARYSVERSGVVKKIRTAEHALAVLQEAISDPNVLGQISRDWPVDSPLRGYHQLITALFDDGPILARTFAISCDRLGGKAGPGRLRICVHDQSPEWCCAAYAVILWRAVRSEQPAAGIQRLHAVCAALWRAAGGTGEPDWRYRLRTVLPHFIEDRAGHQSRERWWIGNQESGVEQCRPLHRKD